MVALGMLNPSLDYWRANAESSYEADRMKIQHENRKAGG